MTGTQRNRPIRVLVAKPGLDGHDVGAKVICRALRDAGMEVIYSGLRKSPATIAEIALQEDVDVVGLSILSGAHIPLCEQLRDELTKRGLADIVWVVGGNIPRKDHDALKSLGVNAIFPTGAHFDQVADQITREVAH